MGILLVYDVTDEASFNNIRNWMRNIEQHASDNVNKVSTWLAASDTSGVTEQTGYGNQQSKPAMAIVQEAVAAVLSSEGLDVAACSTHSSPLRASQAGGCADDTYACIAAP